MHVVAHDPHNWFLLEEEGALYLDVNSGHSAVGFSVLFRLTEEEVGRYREGGEPFLSTMARSVQDRGPSAWRDERNLDGELGAAVAEAVSRWRASGATPPA
jgi:hypothetical protein